MWGTAIPYVVAAAITLRTALWLIGRWLAPAPRTVAAVDRVPRPPCGDYRETDVT